MDLAIKNIENIERHFGIPIYSDGLPSVEPPVFDPFFEGTKWMAEYKWEEAIDNFQWAVAKAKGGHKVALLNLIGNCFYHQGELEQALGHYKESLVLARKIKGREGEAANLDNIGSIYETKGERSIQVLKGESVTDNKTYAK